MSVDVYLCSSVSLDVNSHLCLLCVLQHQQQVAQAVERAKQVTMTELNAIIGVRGLPNLPLTVCIPPLLHSFDSRPGGKTA